MDRLEGLKEQLYIKKNTDTDVYSVVYSKDRLRTHDSIYFLESIPTRYLKEFLVDRETSRDDKYTFYHFSPDFVKYLTDTDISKIKQAYETFVTIIDKDKD